MQISTKIIDTDFDMFLNNYETAIQFQDNRPLDDLNLKFLMVDDDIDDIYTTKRRLKEANIDSFFYHESDPRRLIDTLSEMVSLNEDLSEIVILLDVNMPNVNGFDALQSIKAIPEFKDITVLMLCTSEDLTDVFSAYHEGADGYLVKPIQTDEMFAFLELKNSRQNIQ